MLNIAGGKTAARDFGASRLSSVLKSLPASIVAISRRADLAYYMQDDHEKGSQVGWEARLKKPWMAAFCLALVFPAIVFSQSSKNLSDRAYRDGILKKIADLVENKYVLADKAKGFADEFRAKCASGAYASLVEPKAFATKVNADLIAITRDKHTNFRVVEPSDVGEKAASALHHPVRYYRMRQKENTGFGELKWIAPDVGLLELRRFYSFDQAKDMILAAMMFLEGADAIIIDVRENGGGSGDYLSSYFLPYPTQLSSLYRREGDAWTEFWTRRDIGLEPRTDVPLFILTGPGTFSAAEWFAYDMQALKRATIVGEPSKGGAHDTDLFTIDDRYEIYLSTGRSVSPVTGGNWEGTGVIPDVPVPAAATMDRAVELAKKAAEEFGKKKEARLTGAVNEMQTNLDRMEKLFRDNKADEADAPLEAIFRIARDNGMLSQFFIDVFAYNYQSKEDRPILLAISKKGTEYFPRSADAHLRLAYAYQELGMKDQALRFSQEALELNPGDRTTMNYIKTLGGVETPAPEPPAGAGKEDLSGNANDQGELARIEQAIRDCIGWAKTKDFKLLYGIIAGDENFLEVHPDGNVVKGIEEFRKAEKFWGSPDFKAVRYDIRDLKITLSKSGDTAWFYCLLDDINEWKGQPANWENTRWTGVLEKRDGRWVMAQQHFSFAAKE